MNPSCQEQIHRIELECLAVIHRALAHDFNSKLMGIEGVCEFWNDSPADNLQAGEDMKLILQSLYPIQPLTQFLGSFEKKSPDDLTVWEGDKVREMLAPVLSRFFKPATSFHLQISPSFSLSCAPYFLLSSTAILCFVASRLRASSQDSTALQLESTDENFLKLTLTLPQAHTWPQSDDSLWQRWHAWLTAHHGQIDPTSSNVLTFSIPTPSLENLARNVLQNT